MTVAGCLGLLFLAARGYLTRSRLWFLARTEFHVRAALFSLNVLLVNIALAAVPRTDLPLLTLVNYTWPTLTMLLSVLLLRQPARLWLLGLGSLIVFLGLALEILHGDFSRLGRLAEPQLAWAAVVIFLGASAWALHNVLNRRWDAKAGAGLAVPFMMIYNAMVMGGLRFFSDEQPRFSSSIVLPLTYICLTPCLANLCWDIGTRKGSITMLSLIADALPWASLTATSVLLGVGIDATTWRAAVLIIFGALLSRLALHRVAARQQGR